MRANRPKKSYYRCKKNAHTPQELKEATNAFIRAVRQKWPNIAIISASMHVDEVAPHMHLRFTEEYQTEYGDVEINGVQALREMGFKGEEFDSASWEREHPLDDISTASGKKKRKR